MTKVEQLEAMLEEAAKRFDGILQDYSYDVLSPEDRLKRIYTKALIGLRTIRKENNAE